METISLIVLTISILFGLKLANQHGARINHKLNFVSWVYCTEFLMTAAIMPFTFFIIDTKKHWVFKHIKDLNTVKTEVNFTIAWCAIAIPLGFILANKVLRKMNMKEDYGQFVKDKYVDFSSKYLEISILIISIAYISYTIVKIGYVPHIKLLSSNYKEIAIIRGYLTHNYPASNHLKELIGLTFIPLMSYYFTAKTMQKLSFRNISYSIFYILCSLFFTTINLNKSGFVIYLIGFFIIYILIKNGRVRLKSFLTFISINFIILFTSYIIIRPDYDYKHATKKIFNRIFHAQAFGNYLAFEFFPDEHKFLGLSSISKTIEYLDLSYSQPASRIMMKKVLPKNVKQGTAGFLTSHFFSEAWANFGFIGLILSPIYVGFIIKFFIGLLITIPKNPLSIAAISYFTLNMNIADSFNHILLPRYLIVTFIIFFLILNIKKIRHAL